MGLDPERPITADFLNFAQLPDQFNEKEATDLYINIVALAFGVDVREFWPMTAGGLGTATETLVMHQKAKGKGVGDLISTLERAINWHLLPDAVSFSFDFTDDDEDQARATLDDTRTKTILSMYLPTPDGGDTVATRDEVRQMLADNVTYFHEDFLETDTTSQTSADDTEVKTLDEVKAIYGPTVIIDKHGKVRVPRGYRVLQAKKGGPGSGHYGHAGRPGQVGGSQPAGELIHLSKQQRRQTRIAIGECLAHGLMTGNEAAILIGEDGKKVNGTFTGEKDYCNLQEHWVMQAKVSVHNHPTSLPFSSADVWGLMLSYQHEHMFVIGHDGTLYRMSSTENTKSFVGSYGTFKQKWNKWVDKYRPEFFRLKDEGLPKDRATRVSFGKAIAEFAKEVGLDYKEAKP